MTAKEYLRRAYTLDCEIKAKQLQIERLQSIANQTTGMYEALRVSGTSSRSKLENGVLDIMELKDELGIMMTRYRATYREIMSTIEIVRNPTYRQLLNLRYLCFLKWEEVAVQMGYSFRNVIRLHGEALKRIIVPAEKMS